MTRGSGLVVALACLVGGCRDKPLHDFARITADADEHLRALRPATAMIMAAPRTNPELIIAICRDAVPHLKALWRRSFSNLSEFRENNKTTPANTYQAAGMLLDELFKLSSCSRQDDERVRDPLQCSENCLSHWGWMVSDIERIRIAASKEGVEIVSLLPTWGFVSQPIWRPAEPPAR